MKKPWSITTTLRNPERFRGFLSVLKALEGNQWTKENQAKFQTLLIQKRLYGYGERQFYNDLPEEWVALIDNPHHEITFEQAKKIFDSKNYNDPPHRGRESFNPLKKFGFARIQKGKIKITELGNRLLRDQYDFGDLFIKSFLKWQYPNPDSRAFNSEEGFNLKPFIGTLHLIAAVNQKWKALGYDPKGISKQEFSLFIPTLIHFEQIEPQAQKIIDLRLKIQGKNKAEQQDISTNYQKSLAKEFLESDNPKTIKRLLKNLKDYGDNIIRYFRLTRFFHIRGNGFYIDLEPRRLIEIKNLLEFDNAQSQHFGSRDEYLSLLSDITQPKLPWETREKYIQIIKDLLQNITPLEEKLGVTSRETLNYETYEKNKLKNYIAVLRQHRKFLQDKENYQKSQDLEQINLYIETLENIYDFEDRSLMLEKFASLGLSALNDAIRIQPNYPVGDDNEPTFTAPGNTPDIECFYSGYNAICEVTMLTGRDQWYYEGQPVMRHLRDFENKHKEKQSYCLFIAPKLHRDTLNTFWMAIKFEYEGKPQKIVPLSIAHFVELLKTLVLIKKSRKPWDHTKLFRLYDEILEATQSFNSSDEWIQNIPHTISSWQKSLTA